VKAYNILSIPSFLYGCELWEMKQRDIRILEIAEMKLSLLDHRRSEDVLDSETGLPELFCCAGNFGKIWSVCGQHEFQYVTYGMYK
jgi:hypothetical protein